MKRMKMYVLAVLLITVALMNGCANKKEAANVETEASVDIEVPEVEAEEIEEDSSTSEIAVEEQQPIEDNAEDDTLAQAPAVEEKFSSHETKEIGWAKGTVDRYVYSDGSGFEHYVIKMDDPETGYGDPLTGEKGVKLFLCCDFPGENGLSVSMVGQKVALNTSEHTCFIESMSYSDSQVELLTNATRDVIWKELKYADESLEDGYFKILNEGDVVKGLVEGTIKMPDGSTCPSYVGFVADKTKGQIIDVEVSQKDHNEIDAEILDRMLEAFQIIDADYVEEY